MQIMKAHNQWATRPAEERFWDLPEMLAATKKIHAQAAESTVNIADLRVEAIDDDLRLVGKQGVPATLSHFAFGQLAARAKAPAGYLRGLPTTLAAQNLNHGLKAMGSNDTKSRLLFHRNGSLVLRAATSEKYSRVWNDDLLERVMQVLPDGWRTPPARPVGNIGTERTRLATEADVSRLSQHLGLAVRVGDTIAPAGAYASDKDMFMFLINEDNPISDGTPYPLFRGIMLWNSEVGDMSLGGMAFLLKGTCGNHIIHSASEVMEFNFRHVGAIQSRTNKALEVQIKKYAEDSATEEQNKIAAARSMVLGTTKTEVVDAVLAYIRQKKIPEINRDLLDSAYDAASGHTDWYGDPRTVYGVVNGLTQVSQLASHTDNRVNIDVAAGKVLDLAF